MFHHRLLNFRRLKQSIPATSVSLEGMTLVVVSIDDRVEEESEWRENKPVYKMHYRVTVEDGAQLGIFRNMKTGSWCLAEHHEPGQDEGS